MDQTRREELARQGRAHARQLIAAGSLVLDECGWRCPGLPAAAPEEATLPDEEYAVWIGGYYTELRERRALHTDVTAPFPRSGPLSDDETEALERREHALDCDRADHSRCDAGG